MAEQQNSPIDISKEKVYSKREEIEEPLSRLTYKNKKYDLIDLIRQIDEKEPRIMSALETDTYVTFREGLQIFKTVAEMLSSETGLRQNLAGTAKAPLPAPEVTKLKDFCYNFAAYVASSYVVKKLDSFLPAEVTEKMKQERKDDLGALELDTAQPETTVSGMLIAPVLERVTKHIEGGRQYFKTPYDFTLFVRSLFDKYVDVTKAKKDHNPVLEAKHVNGYRWRIMDDYVSIENWQDKSVPAIKSGEQKLTFAPIKTEQIVGNQSAKRKIARYIDRMVLYDANARKNPILEKGGLAWTVLFDGLPGTGKSSLFRMAMTLLSQRCEQIGTKYNIFKVDQSIKDEYYGKSGKILLEKLGVTNDQLALSLGIFDDLDLLTTTRKEAQGADNDINNILMQYLDGVFTLRLGNVLNFAATNKPTGLDDALRNRFNDRFLIDGPKTGEDFADMLHLELGKLIKGKLIDMNNGKGYEPFATQDIRTDGKWSLKEDVAAFDAEGLKKFKGATIIDFGNYMAELKKKNPRITGRSTKAILESVKERCANFDIPEEWFANKDLFFNQSYDKKVKLLEELYVKIDGDILFQEAERYFQSEERYSQTEANERVNDGYNNMIWQMEAEKKVLEKQLLEGGGNATENIILKQTINGLAHNQSEEIMKKVLDKAKSNDKKK